MHIGPWDIALVAGVSLQATALAYMYHPRWKALLYGLPIPFTLASMSLAQPVGVTHMAGLLLMPLYMQAIRITYQVWRWPIVLSIALGAGIYVVAGCLLAGVLPDTDAAFWISAAVTWVAGLAIFWATPHRDEPGHRSPLPIWIKLPIMASIITGLVLSKQFLQGFMAMFPMMGVITAYEARHSLWTINRQVPVLFITFAPMIAACRLLQGHIGLGPSLIVGWIVLFLTLGPFTWWMWSKERAPQS